MGTDVRAQVWAKTNGHCWYCGKLMNPWDDFTVDHMDPRKQGGGDELPNLIPACKSCNSSKHAKTIEEFRVYLQEKAQHRFWGEHVLIPVQASHAVVEEQDESDLEAFEGLLECLYGAFVYARETYPLSIYVLFRLIRDSDWQCNTAVFYGQTGLEDLASQTQMSKQLVLSFLFQFQRHKILHITMDDTGLIEYSILPQQLEHIEMYLLDGWKADDLENIPTFANHEQQQP